MKQADREKVNTEIPGRFVIDRETGQIIGAETADSSEDVFRKLLEGMCRFTEDGRRQRAC